MEATRLDGSIISHVYSELLVNIRSVSVSITCRTDSSTPATLRARLSPDRTSLTITSSKDNTITVRLPGKVSDSEPTNARLTSSSSSSPGQLTCRVALDTEAWNQSHTKDEQLTPWSATDLEQFECAHCRVCRRNIITLNAVREWRDLPSENWAEMMDFWHCHKPDEPEKQNGHVSGKGYAAAHRLAVRSGLGFVDACHFLVHEGDCSAPTIKTGQATSTRPSQILKCTSCNSILGTTDPQTSSLKLFKSSLALGFKAHTQLTTQPPEKWLTSRLLSLSESTHAMKMSVSSLSTPSTHLLIWIFTPDFYCTMWTPSISSLPPIRAAKILWKVLSPLDGDQIERLEVDGETWDVFVGALERSKAVMGGEGKWQGWDVGFLERFAVEDMKGHCD